MQKIPQTPNELINKLEIVNMEYVGDIVVNGEKKYGLGTRAEISDNGDTKSVLGSVVLEPSSGKPVRCEGTSFVTYIDGLMNDGTILMMGEDAIQTMKELYIRTHSDSVPFKPRQDVSIANDAL